jgi:hypothetical protein
VWPKARLATGLEYSLLRLAWIPQLAACICFSLHSNLFKLGLGSIAALQADVNTLKVLRFTEVSRCCANTGPQTIDHSNLHPSFGAEYYKPGIAMR